MKRPGLSQWALFLCCAVIAACSQPDLSRSQYTPNVRIMIRHAAASSSFQVLHSFGGKPSDGAAPEASLIDVNGTLYGTTLEGGANNACTAGCGTVFSITPAGIEKTLYRFGGGSDGRDPDASLIDVDGDLYGTTTKGGEKDEGTVFRVTTNGTEAVLRRFTGSPSDGEKPRASLIHVDGALYGTTELGGSKNYGTVFSLGSYGYERVLHSFDFSDGYRPETSLIDLNGTLYGTTSGGGPFKDECPNGCGLVYSITPAGTETTLYNFGGFPDGYDPRASLIHVKGALYGTTQYGGTHDRGTFFTISTGGSEKVLYSFGNGGGTDAAFPAASLIHVGGKFYGTTYKGGIYGRGTVFRIGSFGGVEVLHSFDPSSGEDGAYPVASLIDVNGTLYGTTREGGKYNRGIVFALTP